MKFLVQRVNRASVEVEGEVIGKIGQGFLVLVGISDSDDQICADKMIRKLVGLRIFKDEEGRTNLDLKAVDGQLLLVSQFTLYADCRKGNRPSFIGAGSPEHAKELYRYIVDRCRQEIPVVEEGSFGASMTVSLENSGPFTVMLDSAEICGA